VLLGSAEVNQPWKYFWSIPKYVATIPQRHRWTDSRTTCCGTTALCVASRCKSLPVWTLSYCRPWDEERYTWCFITTSANVRLTYNIIAREDFW